MKLFNVLHDKFIYDKRINSLTNGIVNFLPENIKLLDIGCGDGLIDSKIIKQKKIEIIGADILKRSKTFIPVVEYNGSTLPFENNFFDCSMLIDVLHHTEDPKLVLKEAVRVSKSFVLIKDHLSESKLSYRILKLMDDVGNKKHGVNLVYNFLSLNEWQTIFKSLNLSVEKWNEKIGLYIFPLNLIFERNLHFISLLKIGK